LTPAETSLNATVSPLHVLWKLPRLAFITEPTVMETTSSLPPEEELGLVGIDVGMGCHEPSSRKTPRVAMA